MKKLLSFLCITLMGSTVTASEAPKGIQVNLQLSYIQNENGLAQQKQSQSKLRMDTRDGQWITVENYQPSPQSTQSHFFILLSKVEKADAEKANIRFLVLDVGPKANFVFEPTMIVRYGQEATLESNTGTQKIKFKLLVDKTPS